METLAGTLAAISCGAVFMGANSYIGNAPNFMVKAVVEEAGMPSCASAMALVVRHPRAAVRHADFPVLPLRGNAGMSLESRDASQLLQRLSVPEVVDRFAAHPAGMARLCEASFWHGGDVKRAVELADQARRLSPGDPEIERIARQVLGGGVPDWHHADPRRRGAQCGHHDAALRATSVPVRESSTSVRDQACPAHDGGRYRRRRGRAARSIRPGAAATTDRRAQRGYADP